MAAVSMRRGWNRRRLLVLWRRIQKRKRGRQRRHWIREIFLNRARFGEYHTLISEMRLVDHESFHKYFHMSPMMFDDLLSRIGPAITKQTTQFQCPIHVQKYVVILPYILRTTIRNCKPRESLYLHGVKEVNVYRL